MIALLDHPAVDIIVLQIRLGIMIIVHVTLIATLLSVVHVLSVLLLMNTNVL